jgi:putative DNA methylase
MTYRKKLIEVALPLEAINAASAREKSIRHGHPSTLHLWWARRPLAACRAVIFASLVDDPDDPEAPPEFVEACRKLPRGKNAADNDTPRQRLFDFIETLVQWESTTDEDVLETARRLIRLATDGNPPPLLDPFAGGGSIPLEAQRLGLEAHASDLNPVAVMINKALIEIPPRFANMPPVNPHDRKGTAGTGGWKGAAGLAADVRYYGEWMRVRAWERIGQLYPDYNGETVIAWLWARTVSSPNPAVNVHVPLVRNFVISKQKDNRAWVDPQIDVDSNRISFVVRHDNKKPPLGTIERSGGRCLISGAPIPRDYIRAEGQAGRIGSQMLAIVTEGKNGRNYYSPDEKHTRIALEAQPSWSPEMELVDNPRHMSPPLYGMTKYADLFTTRQLYLLNNSGESPIRMKH